MAAQAKIPETGKPRVVIVGGGFGGLSIARSLANADFQVVLVDKQNYHTFQPLLYQVGTASLEAESIVYPFRKAFEDQHNLYFRLAEVCRIDTSHQHIETSIGLMRYDYLVLATGATTNYYGDEQMARHTLAMKNIDDALALRNTILNNFEQALQLEDAEQINSLMDYVIVGGGPTGVEVAGALSELRKHVFPKDYRELDFVQMDIHLIQSGPQLLKGMSEEASRKAYEFLENFGVKIWLNRRVKSYDGYTVHLDSGEKLISRTVLWAAGVTGAPIEGLQPESLKANRYLVDVYNRVLGYENIFAIGDNAAMVTEAYPYGHPMMAQPAIQQGRHLAQNLIGLLKQQPLQPFNYHDQGAMATIGRNHAVADLRLLSREIRTQGLIAWFIWMFIHLISLIGFRNRLLVLLNWLWSYFNFDKGIRLILGNKKENVPPEDLAHKPIS